MNNEAQITALQAEMAGYVRRGRKDRIAAVETELRRLGGLVASPAPKSVPVEPTSTTTTPSSRVRKPTEAPKPVEGTKTPKKRK